MKCEFNNGCYETAQDGTYIECAWNIPNNFEAKIRLEISYDGEMQEWNVCEGCADDLINTCEGEINYDSESKKKLISEVRFAPKTKSFAKRKSTKNIMIQKPWTEEQRKSFFRKLHKSWNKHPEEKCIEVCYN